MRVDGEDNVKGAGELVLLGNGSSTIGYLQLANEKRVYRSLTGDHSCATTARYHTGDRFRETSISGENGWLLYLCRADDLLVHSSGEMTNPLPTEGAMKGTPCVDNVCVVGSHLSRPLMLVQLKSDVVVEPLAEAVAAELRTALDSANASQPKYSHVLPQHMLLLRRTGSLPLTVKGTVQRNKAEEMYQRELSHVAHGQPAEASAVMVPLTVARCRGRNNDFQQEAEDDAYDSLATATNSVKSNGHVSSQPENPLEALGGLRAILIIWILCGHWLIKTHTLNRIWSRAHFGVTFFIVLSGFGMHWALGSKKFIDEPVKSTASYLHARFEYLILPTWISMTLATLITASPLVYGYSPLRLLSCFSFVENWLHFYHGGLESDQDTHGFGASYCPNHPSWFTAALVPFWVMYLPFARFASAVERWGGGTGLGVAAFVVWALFSYGPVLAIYLSAGESSEWENTAGKYRDQFFKPGVKEYPFNLVMTFPPMQLADGCVGVLTAQLARRHRLSNARAGDKNEEEVSLLPTVSSSRGLPTKRRSVRLGVMSDVAVLGLMAITWLAPSCLWEECRRLQNNDHHLTTPLWALLIYSCATTNGAGLALGVLGHPSLVSLGEYSLWIFLFQEPLACLWGFMAPSLVSYSATLPPYGQMPGDAFLFFVISAWTLTVGYAVHVEPIIRRAVRTCPSTSFGARNVKGPGRAGPSAQ